MISRLSAARLSSPCVNAGPREAGMVGRWQRRKPSWRGLDFPSPVLLIQLSFGGSYDCRTHGRRRPGAERTTSPQSISGGLVVLLLLCTALIGLPRPAAHLALALHLGTCDTAPCQPTQAVWADISANGPSVVHREVYFHYTHVANGRALSATGGTDVLGEGATGVTTYGFAVGGSDVIGYSGRWRTRFG